MVFLLESLITKILATYGEINKIIKLKIMISGYNLWNEMTGLVGRLDLLQVTSQVTDHLKTTNCELLTVQIVLSILHWFVSIDRCSLTLSGKLLKRRGSSLKKTLTRPTKYISRCLTVFFSLSSFLSRLDQATNVKRVQPSHSRKGVIIYGLRTVPA